MSMYTPIKDTNTKVVYEWVNNSTGESISIPREDWKHVNLWSLEEIESLFTKPESELYEDTGIHTDIQQSE